MSDTQVKSAFGSIRDRINGYVDTFLTGTHNHYACCIAAGDRSISARILDYFFSKISINKAQTEKLAEIDDDAIVIYAGKYKSYMEFLFFHLRFMKERLPFPTIGMDFRFTLFLPLTHLLRIVYARFDHLVIRGAFTNPYRSGHIREELANGKGGYISLVGEASFQRRYVKSKTDPLRYLIEMQGQTDRTILIVPQLMFFNIEPRRTTPTMMDLIFGSKERPGKLKRVISLLRNPTKIFVELSDPLDLSEFLKRSENSTLTIGQQAVHLRRTLVRQINNHRQSITGPVLKSSEELKENILTNRQLQQFMTEYAKESGTPIAQLHKKADAQLDEISADYNPGAIRIYAWILRWVFNSLFDGVTVDMEGLENLKAMSKKAPLVLVPCHKSHLDYLLLSYIFHVNNMPCPHIAAGKNLSFWPLGPMFRAAGAFFIRRTFKGTVLYPKVFGAYIEKLLAEGFNVEFFIEGGRSRTGKLLTPRFGILSFLIEAMKNGACQDLIFAPIYIGYDRIIEESSYIHEIEGGQKKAESFIQVIRARKFLKKRYGKVYINFHDTLSLNGYLAETGRSLSTMEKTELYPLYRELGSTFINAISKKSIVTPHGLVAAAILNCDKKRFSHDHLIFQVETYMNYLVANEAELADTLVVSPSQALDNVIESYLARKLIYSHSRFDRESSANAVYMVNENRRPALDYYKNNSINFFVPAAFTALAILENEAFQFSAEDLHITYKFLQDLFENEFSHDKELPPAFMVRKNIKAFINDGIIVPHPSLPGTFNLTAAGLKKLNLFASFLTPFFESYQVAFIYIKDSKKADEPAKDRLKKIQALGNKMYKNDELEKYEALSKVTFKNAMSFFMDKGVKSAEDQELIRFYSDALQKYKNYLPS